jgi:hypothetical protein
MVEARKQTSSDSTRIKFQSIFEPTDSDTRRTKVVCTIKFNSNREDLLKMLDAGMNVAVFNFATGDQRVRLNLAVTLIYFSLMEPLLMLYVMH